MFTLPKPLNLRLKLNPKNVPISVYEWTVVKLTRVHCNTCFELIPNCYASLGRTCWSIGKVHKNRLFKFTEIDCASRKKQRYLKWFAKICSRAWVNRCCNLFAVSSFWSFDLMCQFREEIPKASRLLCRRIITLPSRIQSFSQKTSEF